MKAVAEARNQLESTHGLGKYYKLEKPDNKYAAFHYMNGSQIVVEGNKLGTRAVSLFDSEGKLIGSIDDV